MSKELSKNIVCVLVRGGIEIWVEQERAETLKGLLKNASCPQFIDYEGQLINKADITGIFNPITMEDKTRRKNGEWQCAQQQWHERNERCDCLTPAQLKARESYRQNYKRQYGVEPLN